MASTNHWYTPVPDPSRYFPFPRSFRPTSADTETHFEYMEALGSDAACVTFLCQTHGGVRIVVKFAQTYGRDAHVLLASHDMAPALLYCGPIEPSESAPSYGSIKMIAMEYIDGSLLPQLETAQHNAVSTTGSLAQQLKDAVNVLHEGGYVYGDLRGQNIMVTNEGKVKLIDFDWAGRVGEARYPPFLSTIDWPHGVEAFGTIEATHDQQMLVRLIASL